MLGGQAGLESMQVTLFPAGKKRRGEFLIGDVLGSPGDSVRVVFEGEKAGLWTDRATGDLAVAWAHRDRTQQAAFAACAAHRALGLAL